MGKELSEMTLEELWELFPIFLVEHTDKWADDYKEIEILLQDLFASCPIHRISHIGSTTIKGIWAKNIVDVMVEIPESNCFDSRTEDKNHLRCSYRENRCQRCLYTCV